VQLRRCTRCSVVQQGAAQLSRVQRCSEGCCLAELGAALFSWFGLLSASQPRPYACLGTHGISFLAEQTSKDERRPWLLVVNAGMLGNKLVQHRYSYLWFVSIRHQGQSVTYEYKSGIAQYCSFPIIPWTVILTW
jgi:hypothetical protein